VLVEDGSFAESFEWYRATAGLDAAYGDPEGSYADFDAAPGTLALFSRAKMRDALGVLDEAFDDSVVPCLDVDSVDDAVERFPDEAVVAGPTDRPEWGLRTAHVRDPVGTLLELNEPIAMDGGGADDGD
jgi:predicted enzyme related to lactoylglutathione lyase